MNLFRVTSALLIAALWAAIAVPAAADQVFSTTSTGPVRAHTTPASSYPVGDIYYSPCGYGGYGGYQNYGQPGTYGTPYGPYGYGAYGYGRGRGTGNTTITGERFYPYDISSNGTRLSVRGRHGIGYNGISCNGTSPLQSPLPPGRVPMPQVHPSPHG